MQNKGAITLLAIALALVSLYQLSFTWKTNRVEKVAKEYAQGDPVKEKVYLDSNANKEVYNFLGIAQYTYKECKELELNLGLDLRGGIPPHRRHPQAGLSQGRGPPPLREFYHPRVQVQGRNDLCESIRFWNSPR